MIEWRFIITSYPCPTCLAEPGQDCRTAVRGDRKYEPHSARAALASANNWADPEDAA